MNEHYLFNDWQHRNGLQHYCSTIRVITIKIKSTKY